MITEAGTHITFLRRHNRPGATKVPQQQVCYAISKWYCAFFRLPLVSQCIMKQPLIRSDRYDALF